MTPNKFIAMRKSPHLFDNEHAIWVGHAQVVLQLLPGLAFPVSGQGPAGQACLQRAHGLLEALLESATNSHCLPHTLHLGGECGSGSWEFFKGEARDLQDRRAL